MRALLPLLHLLAAAAPPAPLPAPPVLLVARAACRAKDPAALAALPAALTALHARVLSYRETCGADWSEAVTRESLAAMGAGSAVALVGWPGAAACDALSAAARALRAPHLGVCALQTARASAVAQLAVRLGWRRATLPPAEPRSECQAAQREVARALATAAVSTALHSEDYGPSSDPVILCASREGGAAWDAARGAHAGVVLLLHVEEPDAEHKGGASPDLPIEPSGDVERKFHRQSGLRLTSSELVSSFRRRRSTDAADIRTPEKQQRNSSGSKESLGDSIHPRRSDYLFSRIDESLPKGELFAISEERLDDERVPRDMNQVLEEALEAVRHARVAAAGRARLQPVHFTFHVYRRSGEAAAWRRVAFVATSSTPSLDDVRDWTTEVGAITATDAFERLAGARFEGATSVGTSVGVVILAAGTGVALAAVVALAVRWAAARRRRLRRGGDAVLSPADFSFPADEQHCVGDGMETMLSCWLQRLHEFGGPELDRPDLLKRPAPPSVPSSTCSVNRLAPDRRIRYKGDAVHVRPLVAERGEDGTPGAGPEANMLDLKRKAIDVLLLMQGLRHENLNPFIGYLCSGRAGAGPALVWDHCGRGSLEDVLMADDIKLDWTFRLSLLTDLVKGMRYLHSSPLRVHGRLSSRNCVVDSRWVLRVTDYGAPALARAQQLPAPGERAARCLLWTAPELLRDDAARARGTQTGDVYSFGIVMQEVIVRGEPYCMLALSPEEIVEKLRRPPPLIRPSVSMGAAPPEAVSVMRQCWSEAPDLRPDFHRLHDLFRQLHRGRKINIVDSMFEMLEKYSNNLEELIKERTEQLDMEKKKTEQLLNRMLPRSVAERLLLGQRVEPEEFSDVSIYFSDIVGFTALAARSSPVQVVDLLNDLYTTFDAAIERYDVYKVETIGDAYMVVGGLPARAAHHAQSVATMALHLLALAGRFRVRHLPDTPLHLRIGLHSGPVCAAVVGLTMPRYCLFGDTVNTASRMESTGAAWRIQVSAATAERLEAAGGYRLRSRGLIMIKGKGAMHTYWLLGKDGFDRPLPTPPPLPSEEVLFETDAESECEPSPKSAPGSGPSPPRATSPAPQPEQLQTGRARSGVVSADSSPPARARLQPAASVERAPPARYRWGAGAGVLRRQWSLERGDALASAAAERAPAAEPSLLAGAPTLLSSARAPLPRYRLRPEPPDEAP